MQLIGTSRQQIRDRVRAHPDASQHLAGRKVNSLTKDELISIAQRLGIDCAVIVAAEQRAMTRPTSPAPDTTPDNTGTRPVTVTDQDVELDLDLDSDSGTDTDAAAATVIAAVAADAETLRRELASAMIEGDFDLITNRLTTLLTAAAKPPVTVTVTEYMTAPPGTAATTTTAPAPVPAPVSVSTWGRLLGIKGAMASRKINIFGPHPTTPAIDPRYKWPDHVTQAALSAFGRSRNVWLYGPAGTGKTSFAEQLAARTGRPFFLIACDDTTEAPELVGMTVPHQGGVRWQDGVLTAALRVPHAVILIDEPTVARPGAIMVLQSVLQSRLLSIKETGEVVRAAEGIVFCTADNTNGTGGGLAEGYEGTRRMNRATLDRFSTFLRVKYMTPDDEAAALVAHTGCTPELAKMLVECAGLTRRAKVTHALGLRRLIAWAECLTDGLEPRSAFEFAILNSCAKDDREPTEQCCALGLDKRAVLAAISGQAPAAPTAATPRPGSAAADFAN